MSLRGASGWASEWIMAVVIAGVFCEGPPSPEAFAGGFRIPNKVPKTLAALLRPLGLRPKRAPSGSKDVWEFRVKMLELKRHADDLLSERFFDGPDRRKKHKNLQASKKRLFEDTQALIKQVKDYERKNGRVFVEDPEVRVWVLPKRLTRLLASVDKRWQWKRNKPLKDRWEKEEKKRSQRRLVYILEAQMSRVHAALLQEAISDFFRDLKRRHRPTDNDNNRSDR